MLKAGIALLAVAVVTAVAMWAFQIGMAHGLAVAGGGLILYSVPAAIFDWPRLSLTDIVGAALGALSAFAAFLLSLIGW